MRHITGSPGKQLFFGFFNTRIETADTVAGAVVQLRACGASGHPVKEIIERGYFLNGFRFQIDKADDRGGTAVAGNNNAAVAQTGKSCGFTVKRDGVGALAADSVQHTKLIGRVIGSVAGEPFVNPHIHVSCLISHDAGNVKTVCSSLALRILTMLCQMKKRKILQNGSVHRQVDQVFLYCVQLRSLFVHGVVVLQHPNASIRVSVQLFKQDAAVLPFIRLCRLAHIRNDMRVAFKVCFDKHRAVYPVLLRPFRGHAGGGPILQNTDGGEVNGVILYGDVFQLAKASVVLNRNKLCLPAAVLRRRRAAALRCRAGRRRLSDGFFMHAASAQKRDDQDQAQAQDRQIVFAFLHSNCHSGILSPCVETCPGPTHSHAIHCEKALLPQKHGKLSCNTLQFYQS